MDKPTMPVSTCKICGAMFPCMAHSYGEAHERKEPESIKQCLCQACPSAVSLAAGCPRAHAECNYDMLQCGYGEARELIDALRAENERLTGRLNAILCAELDDDAVSERIRLRAEIERLQARMQAAENLIDALWEALRD